MTEWNGDSVPLIMRALGRNNRGSVAARLKEGDKMASFDIIPASLGKKIKESSGTLQNQGKASSGPWLLFRSENGYGKRVPVASFRTSSLNRVGLKGYKFSTEDRLAAVFVVGFCVGEDGESDE